METLTLEINNPVTLNAIATAAARQGVPANAYVLDLVETALGAEATLNGAGASLAQFSAALEALSEGTEHLPATPLTYNREDIYFDHD
ncbi:MAG: hypothetical protein HYR56_35245 [Acidobacteria bacterium]|nr:hypothetical protein [Acidobacteriota bacterium]